MKRIFLSAVALLCAFPAIALTPVTGKYVDADAHAQNQLSVDGFRAGLTDRVVTKVSVGANASTTICPIATLGLLTTEVQVGARTGLGINGQTLTQVERGTAATTPDMMLPAADTLYLVPVAPTNVLTAYSGTAFVSLCIQTYRQTGQ